MATNLVAIFISVIKLSRFYYLTISLLNLTVAQNGKYNFYIDDELISQTTITQLEALQEESV